MNNFLSILVFDQVMSDAYIERKTAPNLWRRFLVCNV